MKFKEQSKYFDKEDSGIYREGKNYIWKHRVLGVKVVTAKTPSTRNFPKVIKKHIRQAMHYHDTVLSLRAA